MNKVIQTIRKLQSVWPAARRHLLGRNAHPYTRILQTICAQEDIWVTTQGDYIQWWRQRETIHLSIHVSQGQCHVHVSSPCAVIEHFPGEFLAPEFLESKSIVCAQSTFTGECRITIDSAIKHKGTLIEILKREGILNYQIASEGDFLLSSAELDPLLEQVNARLQARKDQPDEDDVRAIRNLVIKKLASHNLPLLRVWYHPRVQGRVPRAVFSPRYDVDRAITNMRRIRAIEQKYGVESTFYLRAFCPFYTDADVEALASMSWCPEIALHGEFVTNGRVYGDELKAAIAEKAHLERIVRSPIRGVGMHGGELTNNSTESTIEALRGAVLHYDTTPRPYPGNYLPFRRIIEGKYSNVFGLPHALSDVNIEADRHYGQSFYKATVDMMRQVYATEWRLRAHDAPRVFWFLCLPLQTR